LFFKSSIVSLKTPYPDNIIVRIDRIWLIKISSVNNSRSIDAIKNIEAAPIKNQNFSSKKDSGSNFSSSTLQMEDEHSITLIYYHLSIIKEKNLKM
jgi:hypothetical protein